VRRGRSARRLLDGGTAFEEVEARIPDLRKLRSYFAFCLFGGADKHGDVDERLRRSPFSRDAVPTMIAACKRAHGDGGRLDCLDLIRGTEELARGASEGPMTAASSTGDRIAAARRLLDGPTPGVQASHLRRRLPATRWSQPSTRCGRRRRRRWPTRPIEHSGSRLWPCSTTTGTRQPRWDARWHVRGSARPPLPPPGLRAAAERRRGPAARCDRRAVGRPHCSDDLSRRRPQLVPGRPGVRSMRRVSASRSSSSGSTWVPR
jgi:hypothetical protein